MSPPPAPPPPPSNFRPKGATNLSHKSNVRNCNTNSNNNNNNKNDDEEEEEDENLFADNIRRTYHIPMHNTSQDQTSTIRVKLDEGLFASERRQLIGVLANCKQKLASLRPLNPAKNETIKQKQNEWNEKEKYTLDSLNDFKGPHDERFQWEKPGDGRMVWPSKLQYFLAITSYSIGLGNVIRFPILVQKNGGLAFIIPFVIMLLLEGIPLFYLELAIGQRMRKASISCWHLVSPLAGGIGLASAFVSFLVGLYYNTMVAWTLLYAWASFKASNMSPFNSDASKASTITLPFTECPQVQEMHSNSVNNTSFLECQLAGPYEFYWYRQTLNVSSDVSEWLHFNWPVALCLTIAWLVSYVCLVRGLSASTRIVYVVSIFPYVILGAFLLKTLQLNGMSHGVRYLFEPDWPKLVSPYVWLQAAAQVFFSLGLGFGGLIALSSYNAVNNNCHRDAIKVSLINFGTSLVAGVVIFGILGFRATQSYEKCVIERERQIEFYLSDYNLKVLDYGVVFEQVHEKQQQQQHQEQEMQKRQVNEFVAVTAQTIHLPSTNNNKLSDNLEQDYYSADDAIASIKNLDKQLDLGSPNGSFDYGDSDTEFVLNASNLIGRDELDRIIGRIANLRKCSIEQELADSTQGTGLVFVVLAEAVAQFNTINHNNNDEQSPIGGGGGGATTWTLVFFLMILALGFDSQFGNLEGLLSSLIDLKYNNNNISNKWCWWLFKWCNTTPQTKQNNNINDNNNNNNTNDDSDDDNSDLYKSDTYGRRRTATATICILSLLISLVLFAHGAGYYMFAIFDEYAASFSLVLIALFELLAIAYVYGLKRFADECELMTGTRPPFIVLLSWRYISPALLLVITCATIKQFTDELQYEVWQVLDIDGQMNDTSDSVNLTQSNNLASILQEQQQQEQEQHFIYKHWPNWCIIFGTLLIGVCIVWIPLVAVLKIFRINLLPDENNVDDYDDDDDDDYEFETSASRRMKRKKNWFPIDELKEYHQLGDQEHQVTRLERLLFGFKSDDDD